MSTAFKKNEVNPLTELSELRMELAPNGESLGLICQIRFATAEVEFSSRSYRVGISQARLQLYLEGWEKTLGQDLGDMSIPTVEQSSELVRESSAHGGVKFGVNTAGTAQGGAEGNADKAVKRVDSSRSMTSIQPITVLPNDAWRIEATEVDRSKEAPLDGTALAGERLCVLQRQEGSNRSRISAELQIRKSKICVEPTKGNKWGKRFSILRNKDAIIAKVLEKAISRETEQATNRSLGPTLVASKVEFEEP